MKSITSSDQPNLCPSSRHLSYYRDHDHHHCRSHCHHCHLGRYFSLSFVVIFTIVLNLNLVVSGQNNVGTAVQLDDVDLVNTVEAINKARIEAEQQDEEQARKHAQNVARLAATDQLNSEIITNRTRAYLSCESGEMIVKINFTEPFRGVGYSDYDRSSPCKFFGDGSKYYEMRLPLKGCGTKQEAPRIFINNIILRFHRSYELEEDEIKTIICRYPPPLAPPPPLIAAPILEAPPPVAPFVPAKLSEVELLLIVSALLFLTLLLLGIGIGYYCLKRRNIKVVRKIPPSSPPSEFTYVPPIPRVSLSSSETITSDYPSEVSDERRSILSETSTIRRDHFRYENLGYVPEAKLSHYDDTYRTDQYYTDDDVDIIRQNILAPPMPKINTQMMDDRYVQNVSHTDIEEDIETGRIVAPKRPKITAIMTDDYYVTPTTTTEVVDEITTHRVIVPPQKPLTTKQIDDTYITPQNITEVEEDVTQQKAFGPPVITTKVTDDVYIHPEEDVEVVEEETTHRMYRPHQPKQTIQTLDDYYLHPEEDTEIVEEVDDRRVYVPRQPTRGTTVDDDLYRDVYEIDEIVDQVTSDRRYGPGPTTTRTIQTTDEELVTQSRQVDEFVDDTSHKMVAPRKPHITVKNIDDFYVTNITETETTEQVIKIGRSMPNLLLEVDYEDDDDEEVPRKLPPSGFDVKVRTIPPRTEPSTSTTTTTMTVKETTKFDVILRVIDHPPSDTVNEVDDLLPPPKREKLRTVILTDETFRTIIEESTTIEEYTERIITHPTYGPMFEPPTWQVIFRLFSLPEVRNFSPPTEPSVGRPPLDSVRSYKSAFSAHEVRSVTEEDVSFSRRRHLTASHFVPLPDYPTDDDRADRRMSNLPDPKPYSTQSDDDSSEVKPAFSATRRPRQRIDPDSQPTNTSSVFGQRHLANPYNPYIAASPTVRRRLLEYGSERPYSPDLDALSLEPSQTIRSRTLMTAAYSSSRQSKEQHSHHHHHQQQQQYNQDQEEIKSTTETDVYDWKRYS